MSRPTNFLNATMLSGPALVAESNDWFESLANDFEGTTAPPFVFDGMRWRDTSTSPAVLKVRRGGAWQPFGFGGLQDSPVIVNTDWNSVDTVGECRFISNDAATPNLPTAAATWSCVQTRRPDGTKIQTARRSGAVDVRERVFSGGTWTPWRQVYTANNVVGTVSQSGGIPTGSLFEPGTIPGGGTYSRYADGSAVLNLPIVLPAMTTARGGVFTHSGLSLLSVSPAVFSAAPAGSVGINDADCWGQVYAASNNTFVVRTFSAVSKAAGVDARLALQGRWF